MATSHGPARESRAADIGHRPIAQQRSTDPFTTMITGRTALRGAGLAALFLALLALLVAQHGIQSLDTQADETLHTWSLHSPAILWTVVTEFGSSLGLAVMTALAAGLFLVRRLWWAVGYLALAEGGGSILSTLLKNVFQRPRPMLWPHAVDTSFSFPSGHALFAACLFGSIAYVAWLSLSGRSIRALVLVLCLGAFCVVGISRLYLGVHYPTDILAGFLTGGLWLALLGWLHARLQRAGVPLTHVPPQLGRNAE